MEILPHPLRPARPVFLLPDRSPGLDLIDQIPRSRERVAPMWRGDSHSNRNLADTQLADAVNRSDLDDRPTLTYLANDLRDLVDDLLVVRLVLQVGHTASPRRVVTHGANEQDNRTGIRRRNCCNNGGRIDRVW